MATSFPSDQFRMEQVADGNWAAVARSGASASSNCGIVDLGYATLIFDTAHTPQAAHDLWTAARLGTGRDPSVVVNSHWHFDHTLGNSSFRGAKFFATATTRTLLLEHGSRYAMEVGEPEWVQGTMARNDRLAQETDPLVREPLLAELAARKELALVPRSELILVPDASFEGRHRFPGTKGIQVVEGGGHSESDSVLFVEETEVLFAGDLVTVQTHPELAGGSLDRWVTTLERIERIGAKVIVPGHGPVGPPEACRELREYFAELQALADSDAPVSIPAEYAAWALPDRFPVNVARLRAARRSGESV
ncbi:MAG: MBL fold metallo-hydrolase [Thermoplasmata archaeon]|nr:MBL fold metallo-hydrolase [Thermoplasmata archaeon]